ncbi:MAG: hypothetical protein JXR37_20845 [Kiritimatiellae bacterium]|nr:hypothetical protein [Kiritimatiellia bacterium]
MAAAALLLILTQRCGAAPPPEAGGLSELPPERWEEVPLANGGFQDGLNGWKPSHAQLFSTVPDGDGSGEPCLRFDFSTDVKWTPSVKQSLPQVGPGTYEMRFRIKGRGVSAKRPRQGGVRVSLNWQTNGGGQGGGRSEVFTGTFGWKRPSIRVLVPPDAKPGSVTLGVGEYNKATVGEAFVDDFALHRLTPPDVEAFLRYPNYRGYLPEDGPQTVKVWLRVNLPDAASPATLIVKDLETGRQVAGAELGAGKKEAILELDAATWPLGSYSIEAQLGQYRYPPYIVRKIAAATRKSMTVWFDEHQILCLNGKPTFPIGFYNTVEEFPCVGEGDIARLEKMAEAPVNFQINYTWWAASRATRRRYLGEMQKRGMWYLDTVNIVHPNRIKLAKFPICDELCPEAGGSLANWAQCDTYLARLAAAMREIPGHAGWYVMDERPFGQIPAVFRQYQTLRRVDPDHPTYAVSNKAGELYLWRDAADVFGMDPYPLMNMKSKRPLSLAARETRATAEAVQGSRPNWTVLQFFQGFSSDRWPTVDELRTMGLMSIVEGARGLWFWSFGRKGWSDVPDKARQKEYWDTALSVTKELKQIEPALLAADAPEIVASVSEDPIRWRAREANGEWYVFAYRPAGNFDERFEKPAVEVTFTLKDRRTVKRRFKPDTADWFKVSANRS